MSLRNTDNSGGDVSAVVRHSNVALCDDGLVDIGLVGRTKLVRDLFCLKAIFHCVLVRFRHTSFCLIYVSPHQVRDAFELASPIMFHKQCSLCSPDTAFGYLKVLEFRALLRNACSGTFRKRLVKLLACRNCIVQNIAFYLACAYIVF